VLQHWPVFKAAYYSHGQGRGRWIMKGRIYAVWKKFCGNFKICFGDAVKGARYMPYPNDEE